MSVSTPIPDGVIESVENGRRVAYSTWPTEEIVAALEAMEARRGHSSRWDFGIIGQAGKMRNELQRRKVLP